MVLSERTQVLLSPEQRSKLERIAARTHRSVGAVIRDAIETYEQSSDEERRTAINEMLALELPIDDWTSVKRDIIRRAIKDVGS